MLREIPSTRQRQGEAQRRWFTDEQMDLTVWQDAAGGLIAFQLAYDKGEGEHALEWRCEGGLRHHRVDDGETDTGRYKQTPLLLPDGAVPMRRLIDEFARRSHDIDGRLRERVLEALTAWEG
ncbi:MAG: hypothetical protein U5K33_08180 [Halofilum sp. (in: g-proteobacteria)]|nr:hypothetical protein [Halofilum sp. (in: g-proteobacteria)]